MEKHRTHVRSKVSHCVDIRDLYKMTIQLFELAVMMVMMMVVAMMMMAMMMAQDVAALA